MLVTDAYRPNRVIQILSGSRTGSSLLKSLLAKSPDLTSLNGEEEPYFKMSGNGYGLTSKSDAFTEMINPVLFRRFINTELCSGTLGDIEAIWEWRLRMQFKGWKLNELLNDLDTLNSPVGWLVKHGVWGHYDGCSLDERLPFKEMVYEMPPYVIPQPIKAITNTYLTKCPYNIYRPGVMEALFPEAEFSYIILTRNPAATINGLLDAWQAPYGFHKHLTPYGWWKFDLPPTWENVAHKPTIDRCWLQWYSSFKLLVERDGYRIRLEDLIRNPEGSIDALCRHLEIQTPSLQQLPLVMTSKPPTPFRWKARAATILPKLEGFLSKQLIHQLEYDDESEWV